MALGTWDPQITVADSTLLLQPALLQRLIEFDRQQQLSQLEQLLSAEEKQQLAGLMKLDHTLWRRGTEQLPSTDLLHLIHFFAIAENLPGWEAGKDSPVIPLARMLRERGARLDKSLLHWLKDVNANRYLPYGPL